MMHQFKLEGYVPDGDTIKVGDVVYADTPEEVYRYYVEMVNAVDENGNKRYQSTRVYTGAYKFVQDTNAFFNLFKA